MSPAQIAIMVVLFASVDAVVLYAVFSMCASALTDLGREYPMNELAIGPWREFQSMAIDSMNFGYCIHICTDGDYVHIAPTRLMRLLKAKPMSLPRAQMHNIRRAMFGTAKAKLGKRTIILPRWALMEC